MPASLPPIVLKGSDVQTTCVRIHAALTTSVLKARRVREVFVPSDVGRVKNAETVRFAPAIIAWVSSEKEILVSN